MDKSKKINVGLVQIGDEFGEEYYLPYSIGVLVAYAIKNLEYSDNFNFLLPIYKKTDISLAVDILLSADIVFFSNYVWNHQINIKIAEHLKRHSSSHIIVFGGPHIPEKDTSIYSFLHSNPSIDIASFGEGEIPFLRILQNITDKHWEKVPSIGFITGNNNFIYNPTTERIDDYSKLPSPYLNGVFDPLIKANPAQKWAALIETNRGCPFSCSYCYWGKKTRNRVYLHDINKIFKEIDWISSNNIEFIFCCDANFGMFKRDIEIVRKVSDNKKKYGYPKVFSVQNTKNTPDTIILLQKILNDSGLQKGVNIALQSLNEKTLQSIRRSNIDNKYYKYLQQTFIKISANSL